MHRSVRLLSIASALVLATGGAGLCASDEPREDASVSQAEPAGRSDISADEEVVFYPTHGSYDSKKRSWTISIHGVIYEPEADSWRRSALLESLREAFDFEPDDPRSPLLDRRLRLFLVDNERGQSISVRIGNRAYGAGISEANGHFQTTLTLPADEMEDLVESQSGSDWLPLEAVMRRSDERRFRGRVQLIPPQGLSIISDIDDTIKHSQVGDRRKLLASTFLQPFAPVDGMPELYRGCAKWGIAFHYVSASPWQLYLPLAEFLEAAQYPGGSFHLKHFRLKDDSWADLFQSQERYKLAAIEPILATYPQRQFILIGDTGEQDPEIFAKVARKHPRQILAIFIRNVTTEAIGNPRFTAVQEGLGQVRFQLFDEPESLLPVLSDLASRP